MSDDNYAEKFALKIKKTTSKKGDVGESADDTTKIDRIGEQLGFISREGNQGTKGGRNKTGKVQVHAWVSVEVRNQIAAHALNEGFTQGKLLEKAWEAYKEQQSKKP
jgi:hypothetical protein